MRFLGLSAAWLFFITAAPAQAAWMEARSPHFTVYSEGAASVTRAMAEKLERFDRGMRILLGRPDEPSDTANPVTVYMVDQVGDVAKLCRDSFSNKQQCKQIAGFYDGRVSGSVAFVPRNNGTDPSDLGSNTILFHEHAHHLMATGSGAVYPEWYQEGFAEYVATANVDKPGQISLGLPPRHRAYGLLNGKPLSLLQLLSPPGKMSDTQREALYGRGWLLTHYLSIGSDRAGQLLKYLNDFNAGMDSVAAARAAFGDLGQLDKELDRYLGKGQMAYFKIPLKELTSATITLRQLSAGEAALMNVRMQSERVGDNAEMADALVVEARRRAMPFPDDAGAQIVLAQSEFSADQWGAAEAAVDRALKVDPTNRFAMVLKARALIGSADAASKFDDATWRVARMWLLKANKVEPDAAWPLWLFYRSFQQQGRRATPNAVNALDRALQLAPQDEAVRFAVAHEYIYLGKLQEARAILLPLAFNPHAPAGNPVRQLIDLIDKGDKEAIRNWRPVWINEDLPALPKDVVGR